MANPPVHVYGNVLTGLRGASLGVSVHSGPWKVGAKYYALVLSDRAVAPDTTEPAIQMVWSPNPFTDPWTALDESNSPSFSDNNNRNLIGAFRPLPLDYAAGVDSPVDNPNKNRVYVAYSTGYVDALSDPIAIKAFNFDTDLWETVATGGPTPYFEEDSGGGKEGVLQLTTINQEDGSAIVLVGWNHKDTFGVGPYGTDSYITRYTPGSGWGSDEAVNDTGSGWSTIWQILMTQQNKTKVIWDNNNGPEMRISEEESGAVGASAAIDYLSPIPIEVTFPGLYLPKFGDVNVVEGADIDAVCFPVMGDDFEYHLLIGRDGTGGDYFTQSSPTAGYGLRLLAQSDPDDGLFMTGAQDYGYDFFYSKSTDYGVTWVDPVTRGTTALDGWTSIGLPGTGSNTIRGFSPTIYAGGTKPAILVNLDGSGDDFGTISVEFYYDETLVSGSYIRLVKNKQILAA